MIEGRNIAETGYDWSVANGNADLLEEKKKIIKAQLEIASDETTASGKERQALADPNYLAHVEGMVSARTEANIAKAKYEAARVNASFILDKNATERAAMKHTT